MGTKVSETSTNQTTGLKDIDGNGLAIPLKGKTSADENKLLQKPIIGVKYNDPRAKIKNREHKFYLFAKNVPAIAGIVWMATQPTGWIVWSAFIAFYVMNILSMSLGYHRYFTHKIFETSNAMRYVLAIWAQLGVYGSLQRWVAEHKRHHAHSDLPGDIHSPYYDIYGKEHSGFKGMNHAHLGWVFVDCMTDEDIYGKSVKDDKAILFADKHRMLLFFISVVILPALWALAFGGDTGIVIGSILIAGFLRCTLSLHAIASLNSIVHKYGKRRFETTDKSHNNWLIAIFTLGEGWHNNHHAHPRSANAGLAWYEIDVTSWVIWGLEKCGLIWNVQWTTYKDGEITSAKRTRV